MRSHRIEDGLTDFAGPSAMFQPPDIGQGELKTLAARMTHYKVPGVSIAVIADWELAWAKGYGVVQSGSDRAVTTETLFQAASTSKLISAALALHLVEQGALGLDRDVNAYLRSWRVQENAFTAEQTVTLRLLLTHQAGLPASNFDQEQDARDPTLQEVLAGQAPAINQAAVVEYAPGTRWQYSNLGYVIIQQLLEDVSGVPFAQLARGRVRAPQDAGQHLCLPTGARAAVQGGTAARCRRGSWRAGNVPHRARARRARADTFQPRPLYL